MSTGRRQWLAALTVAAGIHAAAALVMLSDGSRGAGGNGAGGFGGGIRVSLLPGTSGDASPSPAGPGEAAASAAPESPEILETPEPIPEPPPEEIVEELPVEEPTVVRPPEPSQLVQLPEAREPEPVPEPEPAPEPAPPPEPEPEPEPEPIPEPEPVEEEVAAAIPEQLPPPEPTPPQPAIDPPPRPQVKPTPTPQPVQAAALQPTVPTSPAPERPARAVAGASVAAQTAPGPADGSADPSPDATTDGGGGGGGGGTPAGDGQRMDYATVLSAWLEQYKEYPRRAQSRRYEGIATLRFTVDRQGNVLSYRIDESSGHAALDRAVEEMIERAQPLPPMPDEITATEMEVVLPVAFRLE